MKKLLLALPILTLPLTAMAQDKPTVMPKETLDAAIKQFKPAFCSDDVSKMAKAVYDCYINVGYDATDSQYQKCLIADVSLSSTFDTDRKTAKREGKPDPYPTLPSFFEVKASSGRVKRFFSVLDTKGYTSQEKKAYLLGPVKEFDDYLFKSCNK